MTDPFALDRFVTAQQDGAYTDALSELRRGRKTSHWMWFVFPQVQGLGRSTTAQRYAVTGLDEARAYLAHPVLGSRLRECASALLEVAATEADAGRRADAAAVLGPVDATKLRSSMTLFARAADDGAHDPTRGEVFRQVLAAYFDGDQDPATLERLAPA
jgi:uncharacterized protein (DUF1810 family)